MDGDVKSLLVETFMPRTDRVIARWQPFHCEGSLPVRHGKKRMRENPNIRLRPRMLIVLERYRDLGMSKPMRQRLTRCKLSLVPIQIVLWLRMYILGGVVAVSYFQRLIHLESENMRQISTAAL